LTAGVRRSTLAPMEPKLCAILDRVARDGRVVVLTGAGISAESGIPTFRGPQGYWTVGSKEYHPQVMATLAMFTRQPEVVWPWYLYRRAVCRAAAPNTGHRALVDLERHLGDRFVLVTQNVDGLHRRAGSSVERTWEIHGNVDRMRCAVDCGAPRSAVPEAFDGWKRDRRFGEADAVRLRCAGCGSWMRPHVLWFDEYYDEPNFRYQSSLVVTSKAHLLLVVGTSGATTLPSRMAEVAARTGAAIVDVNPDDNPFADLAVGSGGFAARGPAGDLLPQIVARLIA
jgi:NAD-dependent protein deacetylase/lipoamidase